ncbi:MAG TPA: ATPase, T2SS/T4P/T4SS family [Bryobacteraceae bacterium]|nr:ATPase, T2SS/T4P/T4SS family [Bryobacteraceae bacterium]
MGEVRGATAYDLLQAMNTGHSGTMTTLHANTGRLALNRLAAMALRADKNLDHSAIRAETADVIRYVVQIRRGEGRRYFSECSKWGVTTIARTRSLRRCSTQQTPATSSRSRVPFCPNVQRRPFCRALAFLLRSASPNRFSRFFPEAVGLV